jgi:hypothetical protein
MDRWGVTSLTIALGLGATLACGIATASTHSPSIHACASKSSGALRLATHCHTNERAVTWNERGPRGKRGHVGPTGPTLAGTFTLPGLAVPGNSPALVAIPLTALPSGNYTYAVSIAFHNADSGTYYSRCQIDGVDLGGAFQDDPQSSSIPPSLSGPAFNPGGLTLVGTFTKADDTSFEPSCYTGDGNSGMTMDIRVVFTKVDKIVISSS